MASAIVTLLGTSSPLLTRVSGNPSAVSTSFYRITNGPIGCLLAFVLGVCPLLALAQVGPREILAVARRPGNRCSSVDHPLGARGGKGLLVHNLPFLGLPRTGANAAFIFKTARGGFMALGGYIAHVGLALVLVGIIATSRLHPVCYGNA